MRTKIGVAIAGLGFGKSVHIPAINSVESFALQALWHPSKKKLDPAIREQKIPGYTDWEELLHQREIEALIITTPPAPRFELAYTALEAGKHLLLEKPVGLSSEEIQKLLKLSMKKNLSVAVNFEYRAVPLFMEAKRLIEEGFVGKPWLVKLDWLMGGRADSSRNWNWYSNKDEGGGVIGALGTHAFDILHWLIGPSDNIRGKISTSITERHCLETDSLKKVNSEDVALAHLDLTSNETGLKIPAQLSLSSTSRNGRGCWIEIYGEDGNLLLGSSNQKDYVHGFGLWGAKGKEELKSINPSENVTFKSTWSDGRVAPVARLQNWWGQSIKGDLPMIPGLYEGLESQRACEALKKSSDA